MTGKGSSPRETRLTAEDYYRQLAPGTFPLQEIYTIGLSVSQVLSSLHVCNIVHCDVKPENLIRTSDGCLFLVDFGLACHLQSGQTCIQQAGTIGYVSPECLEGEPLSDRSDIYSLGALLYRFLTDEVISCPSGPRAEPPLQWLWGPLGSLVMSMLRRVPRQRPSAVEVHQTLHELQAKEVMGYPQYGEEWRRWMCGQPVAPQEYRNEWQTL